MPNRADLHNYYTIFLPGQPKSLTDRTVALDQRLGLSPVCMTETIGCHWPTLSVMFGSSRVCMYNSIAFTCEFAFLIYTVGTHSFQSITICISL